MGRTVMAGNVTKARSRENLHLFLPFIFMLGRLSRYDIETQLQMRMT